MTRRDILRFEALPKRWIVEFTLAGISRCRRLAGDFERHLRKAVAFVRLRWIVFSGPDRRRVEARDSAATVLSGVANKRVGVLTFRDGYFPFQGLDIRDYFEALKGDFAPALIVTYCKSGAHQDHRLVD